MKCLWQEFPLRANGDRRSKEWFIYLLITHLQARPLASRLYAQTEQIEVQGVGIPRQRMVRYVGGGERGGELDVEEEEEEKHLRTIVGKTFDATGKSDECVMVIEHTRWNTCRGRHSVRHT